MSTRAVITIEGYLVGSVWWPPEGEYFKPVHYDATAQQARAGGKMTLRDHLLRLTNDGDFQGCVVGAGTLYIDHISHIGSRIVTHSRAFPLHCFKSIADMVHDDPDWMPAFDED